MWINYIFVPMVVLVPVAIVALAIAIGCIWGLSTWLSNRSNDETDNMYSQPSGREEDSEPDNSDEERATVMIGQKYPYGEGVDSPIFQVTDVDEDENEVRGVAIFPLPAGAKNIDIEPDPDSQDCFAVEYTLPDGRFVRDPRDLSNAPDALSDWDVVIVGQMADPAEIEIKK